LALLGPFFPLRLDTFGPFLYNTPTLAPEYDKPTSAVALSRVPNVGPVTYRALIDAFGGPAETFAAPYEMLIRVDGVGQETAKEVKAFDGWDEARQEVSDAGKKGISIIALGDPAYPAILAEIYDPPSVLYVTGEAESWPELCVAVVGTRTVSEYGRRATKYIVSGLVEMGVGVISGMARGVDSVAHRAALKAGGFTAAVLGSGADIVYPPESKRLYQDIKTSGFIVSEYPLSTRPDGKNFPRRNRIISGLSHAVIVAEAPRKSGALITAAHALEQNRGVFAVPGGIFAEKSRGALWLLNQGAVAVYDAEQVLEEIAPQVESFWEQREADAGKGETGEPAAIPEDLSADEKGVLGVIADKRVHIDEIGRTLDVDAAKVSRILTILEIKGLIRQLPGKHFVRE
jgi:DNA processing protein